MKQTHTKVKVGIVGAGYWGPNLIRNFVSLDNCTVEQVCDLKDENICRIQNSYPSIKCTSSFDEMLDNKDISAIVIATPISKHFEHAKKVLRAGKHVLVEKPLATTTIEAQELIDLSVKQQKILMVGHTFEYNSAVIKIKEYIKQGGLGDIYYIYSQRLNLGIVRQDCNTLWNLAPHDISIILYLLEEEPVSISASGASYLQESIEDIAFVYLMFASGKSAQIHVSWLSPDKIRQLVVVGSKKMLVYDDTSLDAKIKLYDKGIDKKNINYEQEKYKTFQEFQLLKRVGDIIIPKIDFQEPLKAECSHFIDCIINNKTPLTDGFNGLRTVKVLEAADKCLKAKNCYVKV